MKKFMCFQYWTKAGLIGASALALSACNAIELPFGQTASSASSPDLTRPAAAAQSDTEGLEVEAPDVFFLEQAGLWDGRPSLGGVWVAHPDVTDPERVLVTNLDNGETVVGALFRRERENHGPEVMISSDAAAALNVIAGQPTEFSIVALRPQEIPEDLNLAVPPPEPTELADATDIETDAPEGTALPGAIAATALDATDIAPVTAAASEAPATASAFDVATLAESAIADSATPAPAPAQVATLQASDILADTAAISASIPSEILASQTVPEPAVVAEPAPRPAEVAELTPEVLPEVAALPEPAAREDLTRPYIQIGIFSAQANADTVATALREGGVIPSVLDQSNEERNLFRVIVGPARNSEDRAALLETVQGLGYEDAYFVTN